MKVCTTCGTEYPDEQKFCPKDGSALRSTEHGNLIDSVIADRYHISEKLGEGGMGAVYLGEHVKMGRKSAIKVMAQGMSSDPDAIARFNREAANAARINHPNVCAIYDFGETPDGVIYLAMEFIEGEALSELIEREGALPPVRAAAILQQSAEALRAAHELGIVHRDLKPDNIMLAKGREGSDLVKVVDFGIAKAMGGEEGQQVTKTGLVVGTPEYMSPEQLSGDMLDGRSDIYSLALVFYRMLTGVLPFQADSAQETMIKRLTDSPIPLNQAQPGVVYPDALQKVMDKALARMPGERYTIASEFADGVLVAVRDIATEAGDTVAAEAATQLMGAQSAPPIAAPAGGLVDDDTVQLKKTRVSGMPPQVTTPTHTPTTPRPIPSPEPPSKKKLPVGAIAAVVAVVVVGGVGVGALKLTSGNGETAGIDTASTGGVTGDTAQRLAVGDSGRTAQNQRDTANGGREGDSTTPVQPPADTTTPPISPTGIQVDPGTAFDWLDNALVRDDLNSPGLRDTALAYYTHATVPRVDKAFAAYVIASTYGAAGNTALAISWGDSAVRLDPTVQTYQTFVSRLRGGSD